MKVNVRGFPKDTSGSDAATRVTHSTHATHIIGDRSSICIDVDKENSNSNCSNDFSAANEKIMPQHSSLHRPSCSNISSRAKVTGEFLNSNGNDQKKSTNVLKAKAPIKLVLTQTLFSRSSQAATPSTSNLPNCRDDIGTISEVKNESSNKDNSKNYSTIEICNSANNNSKSASFQIEGRDKNSIIDDAAYLPKKILSENNDHQQIAQKLQKRIREQDGMICKLNGQIGRHNNNLQESKLQLTKAISELKIKDDEISSLKSNVRSADGHVTLMRYRINKINSSSNNNSTNKYEDTLGADNNENNETEDHETDIKSRIYLTAGMKEVETVNGGVVPPTDYDFLLSQVQFYWIHHYRKLSKVLSSIRGECLASNSHINIATSEIERLDLDPLDGDASFPDVAMANGSQKSAARCAKMDPQSDNYLGRQNGIRVDIFSSEYGATSSLTPQMGGDGGEGNDNDNKNHNHNHLENNNEKEEEPSQLTAVKNSEKVDEVSDSRVLSNIDVLQLPRMETHSPTLLKKLLATWPTSNSASSVSPSQSLPTSSVISTVFLSNSSLQTSKPVVPTTRLSVNVPTLFDRIASLPDFKSSENSFSHHESVNSSFDLNCSIGSSNFSFITQDPGVSSKPLVNSLMGTPNAFKVHISKLRQENEVAKAEISKFKNILDKYRSL